MIFADKETADTQCTAKIRFFFCPKVPDLKKEWKMMEILVEMKGREITKNFFHTFVPLMFLQGSYFSAEGALGLPKAKSWWEHCLFVSLSLYYKNQVKQNVFVGLPVQV